MENDLIYRGSVKTKVSDAWWDEIDSIPAVDAVEVRHGHWMTTDAFPHHVYCSVCFKTYVPNDRWQIWRDKYSENGLPRAYCPNCGARMDGRREDGDA